MRTRTTRAALLALVTAGLIASGAPVASAQISTADCDPGSPTASQYCPPTIVIEREPDDPSSSGLPFTGYDAGIVALAAVALIGAGFGIRRISRTSEGAS